MSCSNCGFIKVKTNITNKDEKAKKCRLCCEEYNGFKKDHNKTERHAQLNKINKNLKKVKKDRVEQIEIYINNILLNQDTA